MMFQLERRDNMFKKYDIIELDNNIEYIIIDIEIIDSNTYLLTDRIDEKKELMEEYKLFKLKNNGTKFSVIEIGDKLEFEKIKKMFLEKLANK